MSEKPKISSEKIYRLLEKAILPQAVDYCYDLWKQYPFQFKISKDRSTKLGDYRYFPTSKTHIISVNQGLNTYAFLITFIHEVAHRITMEKYGRKVKPHGKEWQQTYRSLLQPLLQENIFPEDILILLIQHINRPKASSCADPQLYQVLKNYDLQRSPSLTFLQDIHPGERFVFRGKAYVKEVTKRTRALCKDVGTGKKWLIPLVVEVECL